MIRVRVPASTANLGPGFDSLGMALNIYLDITAEKADTWHFKHLGNEIASLPSDYTHFIAQKVTQFCHELNVKPFCLNVTMKSDIPLARGLGSSGTALIASLLLVNYYGKLNLSTQVLVNLLSKEEGHPDNVVPSLVGGVIAGCYYDETCSYVTLPAIDWPLYVVIPPYELKTEDARRVLPSSLALAEAVEASAISNVLVAALAQKDYVLAGRLMVQDRFHEPYRSALIQDYQTAKRVVQDKGSLFISGAGSTIFVMGHPEYTDLDEKLKSELPHCAVRTVSVDTTGAICAKIR
ncbi:homoserine kinase [Macrococcus brunensis]|uniref:Homoserine kinase n=1 Tax=Macrococcus brunensis TaxID=198483 RepID=A0A4R6BBW9_9STAP|nr:homoserine kinase [Macrococcus brunensis]TDL95316.1 homoserine kinase [Macrococcus brunensis]